jgi:hypothetical protein
MIICSNSKSGHVLLMCSQAALPNTSTTHTIKINQIPIPIHHFCIGLQPQKSMCQKDLLPLGSYSYLSTTYLSYTFYKLHFFQKKECNHFCMHESCYILMI